jgi:small subunit ribosomal protein S1
MTTKILIGKSREEPLMNFQNQNTSDAFPDEPDENWWAALLADEPPAITEPEVIKHRQINEGKTKKVCKNRASVDWKKAYRIFQNDEIIFLRVVGCNQGGLLVSDESLHGFVPASHLIDLPAEIPDADREHYLTSYVDREISLKIIECEQDLDRVVLSERAALAEEGKRKHLLENLCEGDIVSGIVTNITSFGAFIDLGGLEGLAHVSELSWGRVVDPSEVLKVDDQVEAMVLHISESEAKIALSIKRLKENPWEIIAQKLSPGEIIDARITNIEKYGAFARLDEGIEGLIHISTINFPMSCYEIEDFLFENQPVKVRVINIDPKKRRLGLKLESY